VTVADQILGLYLLSHCLSIILDHWPLQAVRETVLIHQEEICLNPDDILVA